MGNEPTNEAVGDPTTVGDPADWSSDPWFYWSYVLNDYPLFLLQLLQYEERMLCNGKTRCGLCGRRRSARASILWASTKPTCVCGTIAYLRVGMMSEESGL